ncbi:MAG: hypothetical protein J0G33_02800 [Afipia felis]|nr:hypothetical protein [Afipia felis]
MLYAPYVSPVEKKLSERLKAARARMEGQAYRRDARAALPMPVVEISKSAPVVAESWAERQKRLWFWIEKDLGPVGPVTISMIQEIVCDHYGITHNDLICKRRTANVVFPRQVAMYLCKALTPHSLPKISARFGGRDHTTCLSNVRKIERLKAIDPELTQTIETLISKIKGEDDACVTPAADCVCESLADGVEAAQSSPRRDGIDAARPHGSATQVRKSQTTEA